MSLQPAEVLAPVISNDPDILHLYCPACDSWFMGRQYAGCGKDITDDPDVDQYTNSNLCVVCKWWDETYEPCQLCGAV